MANSKELSALNRAIAADGQFFCKSCWSYRNLAGAKKVPGKGKICPACVAKVAAAKRQHKAGATKTNNK